MTARHRPLPAGAVILLLGSLAACSGADVPVSAERVSCVVTSPSARPGPPPPELLARQPASEDRWFGEGSLWVSLPAQDYHGERRPDGYWFKIGWWRLAEGRMGLVGTRIDGQDGTATTEVPSGYGATGFQPTGILFSRPGCWRVTGSLNDTKVEFVMKAG